MSTLRIGVISDTHGLLRPEAIAALAGSELIVHAGDIGHAGILEQLGTLAPVVAVRGNNDRGDWAAQLPETVVIEAGGRTLYMLHDVALLDVEAAAAGHAAVIAGHSHRPSVQWRDGVLFLNPGSAGPRRFSLPIALARLTVSDGALDCQIVHLPV